MIWRTAREQGEKGPHLSLLAPSEQGRLVDDIGELRAGETTGDLGERAAGAAAVQLGRHGDRAQVHRQDVRAAALVRQRHYHPPRQPARPRERWVQHLSCIQNYNT